MEELETICKIVRDQSFRYSSDDMGPIEFRRMVMTAIAQLAERVQQMNARDVGDHGKD